MSSGSRGLYLHNKNIPKTYGIYKQNKIRSVAESYRISHDIYNQKIRFDVVEIIDRDITHIENAF